VLPATGPPKSPTSRDRTMVTASEHRIHRHPPRPARTPKQLTLRIANRTLADLDPQGSQLHTPIHSPSPPPAPARR
jgi:hypothetical protein